MDALFFEREMPSLLTAPLFDDVRRYSIGTYRKVQLPGGPPGIQSQRDANCSAFVIACYSAPGLFSARTKSDPTCGPHKP